MLHAYKGRDHFDWMQLYLSNPEHSTNRVIAFLALALFGDSVDPLTINVKEGYNSIHVQILVEEQPPWKKIRLLDLAQSAIKNEASDNIFYSIQFVTGAELG